MTFRGLVLQVHLWLSLVFAVVILIACVTGAALVYRHDIDRALHPALYHATPGDVGWDAAWNAARTRYPQLEATLIRGPVDRRVYQVEIGDRLLPPAVHIDPGSGRILGEHDPPKTLAGWLFILHFNMFAGDAGHVVIGVAGAALVVITLTGIWLWWPTFKRFAFGFRIRWRRPAFVVNYDVHRVVGIISLPLVFLVALTGTFLVFYGVGSRVVHGLFLTTPEAAAAAQTVPSTTAARGLALPLSLDAAATVAAALLPGSRASSMYISGPGGTNVKVWLRTHGHSAERRLLACLDRSKQRPCHRRDAAAEHAARGPCRRDLGHRASLRHLWRRDRAPRVLHGRPDSSDAAGDRCDALVAAAAAAAACLGTVDRLTSAPHGLRRLTALRTRAGRWPGAR